MNKEEIEAMEAGEGLDKVVCNEIFNRDFDTGAKVNDEWRELYLPYSTDILAAWQVRQRIFDIMGKRLHLYQDLDNIWWAKFGITGVYTDGKEAPEAISKAALLAKIALEVANED